MTSTITPPQPHAGQPPQSPPPYRPDAESPQGPVPQAGRSPRDIPVRTLLADLAGLGALGALAVFGFQNAYGGTRYFLAGVVGLVAGMAVAWLGARRRLGTLATAAFAVLVYFVVGGVVVAPEATMAGFVPTPDSLWAMADGAISGWARLLTSVAPVGEADNLLAVPFVSGLLCGLLSLTVTLRSRRPLFALVFPALVLALGILFGTEIPANGFLQGSVFAVVALSWASYRYQARRRIDTGRRRSARWIGVVAMLGLAAVVSATVGESIPGAGRPRVVLRDDIDPPFDPSDYPSPLAGYRKFTNGPNDNTKADQGRPESQGWRHTELFEVRGLPDDERLRLATLDTYTDGVVYEVGTGSASSGYFKRVGRSVEPELDRAVRDEAEERTVEIEVLEGAQVTNADDEEGGETAQARSPKPYEDIWLPLPQHPSSIEFDAAAEQRNTDLASSLRLNTETGAAAVPKRVTAGDRYTVTYMDVEDPESIDDLDDPSLGDSKVPKPYPVPEVQGATMFTSGRISDCDPAGSSSSEQEAPAGTGDDAGLDAVANPVERAYLIGDNLANCGGLDDGRQGQGGHGAARLRQMMPAAQGAMVGNGEQFAPLAALMANAIGVDARVVMGFRSREESNKWREENQEAVLEQSPEGTYVVMGNDIEAWIEINVEDHGWVPIDVTPDKADPVVLPQPQAAAPQNEPPPPPPSIPPSDEDEVDTDNSKTRDPCEVDPDQPQCDEDSGGIPWGTIIKYGSIPLVPIAVVSLITGIIAWLKARRRNHRRNDGPADVRVKGGWDEVTDLACDLGSPVPPRVTRREAAGLIANKDATHLARHADGAVFGPYDLADADVERYWNEVDSVRSSMVSELSRFGRWKVLVSLSSLRLSAQRNRAARRTARAQGGGASGSGGSRASGGGPRPPAGHTGGSPSGPPRGDASLGGGAADRLLPGAAPGIAPDIGGGLR